MPCHRKSERKKEREDMEGELREGGKREMKVEINWIMYTGDDRAGRYVSVVSASAFL